MLQTFTVSQKTNANHLPDELLDIILQLLDGPRPPHPYERPHKPSLKACSLVCKRWHRIVLPCLFRSVLLDSTRYTAAITSLSPTSPHVRFFTGDPDIAAHVQHLRIVRVEMEDTHGLDLLLGSLTSLRELELEKVVICVYNDDLDDIPPSPDSSPIRWASHTVETFTYREHSRKTSIQCASFARFLALFKEIGELRVNAGDNFDVDSGHWPTETGIDRLILQVLSARDDASGASNTNAVPQISKLCCEGECVGVFFIPTYLLRLGALGNLTHLAFMLTHDTDWDYFFDVVSQTHLTLKSLNIEILSFSEEGLERGIENTDIAPFQAVLRTCAFLEKISIIAYLPWSEDLDFWKFARHSDGRTLCRLFKDHEPYWLAIIHLLQSLPPLAPLRCVKIGLRGTSIDPHILDWKQFKEWCLDRLVLRPQYINSADISHSNTSRTLEKIEVELWQVYDQRPCMHYEMAEVLAKSRTRAFLPRFQFPGEEAIVPSQVWARRGVTTARYECRNVGCRWYRYGDD